MARNTAVLLLLRIAMPMLSVVMVLTLSRVLGVEGLGRYTLACTFLYFFDTVANLGLRAMITREAARNRAAVESMLANASTLGTLTAIAMVAVMAGTAALLQYDPRTQGAIALLSLVLPASTLAAYFEATLIAFERMEYVAVSALADNLVKVGAGVGVLLSGFGLDAVILALVAGRVVACVTSAALLRRVGIRVRFAMTSAVLRPILRETPTFLLTSVFATLYWRIDTFMLSKLRSVEDVGCYGAAMRLLELALIVPQSFCLALYPQLASAAGRDLTALAGLGRSASRYLFAASFPAAAAATVVAGPLLVLLYGEPFRSAADTLVVLMWTIVPYGWVRYHAFVLVAANYQRVDLAFNALLSMVNILLDLVLIPAYGPLGAGIATFVSICLYAVAQYAYLRRRLPGHAAPVRPEGVPVVAAALMCLCLWLVAERSIVVALVLAPLVYGGVLVAAGYFTSSELRLLRLHRLAAQLGHSTKRR